MMAFCVKCGSQHVEGAKFCAACGAPVDAHNLENSHRNAVYAGELLKCPNCGEILDSFIAECPACGYELRGAKSSGAIHEFALRLGQIESEEQKINLIRIFPIPNSKEDIFEFMILASSNFGTRNHSDTSDASQLPLADAWLVKFEQSYQKAVLLLRNDRDFPKIQKLYDEGCEKIAEEKKRLKTKQAQGKVAEFLAILAKHMGTFCGVAVLVVAAEVDASGGNSSMLVLIGGIVLIVSACTLARRNAGFIELAIGALSGIALFGLSGRFENGAILDLIGGVILIIIAVNYFKSLRKAKEQ